MQNRTLGLRNTVFIYIIYISPLPSFQVQDILEPMIRDLLSGEAKESSEKLKYNLGYSSAMKQNLPCLDIINRLSQFGFVTAKTKQTHKLCAMVVWSRRKTCYTNAVSDQMKPSTHLWESAKGNTCFVTSVVKRQLPCL